MKKLILAIVAIAISGSVFAQQVNLNRENLGSGSPELKGMENAQKWDNDIYHAPQYLPGFPTASTIWPRVIDVRCEKVGNVLNCDGYHWTPNMGRGEYLMIHPVVKQEKSPTVVIKEVPVTVIKEVPVIILKEVPVKTKKE